MPSRQTHQLRLTLAEPKKSCGKYCVDGTENHPYPKYIYLDNAWVHKDERGGLPNNVVLTIEVDV